MTPHSAAFLLPGDRIDRRTSSFGVYVADGQPLPDAAIRSSSWTTVAQDRAQPVTTSPLILGPALFAGSVDKQFGFVLLNALGRLWALQDLPPETVIVYAAKPQAKPPGYGVVPLILRALGLANPVIITEQALRFETLYTAEERFGECRDGTGTPAFYDWIDSRLPPPGPPDPQRKVYVTRRQLGPKAGRFACEDHLETLLAAEGYDIYAPEAHSLPHQIATFQTAGKLIFAEGSGLHLFALLRRPGQLSAVIHRREALPDVMLRQMADRPGQPTHAINAVQQIWWPPQRGDHLGLSVLDFDRLRSGLVDAGLINGTAWQAPSADQVAMSLQAGLAPDERLMNTDQRADWLKQQREARRKG